MSWERFGNADGNINYRSLQGLQRFSQLRFCINSRKNLPSHLHKSVTTNPHPLVAGRSIGTTEDVIFPYFRSGETVNRKYRTIKDKHFRLEVGCEFMIYGRDDIDPEKPIIWVEGECDKLACEVAEYRDARLCSQRSTGAKLEKLRFVFAFLDADRDKIEAVKHHIIAVDCDAPGMRLEDELSRRLGLDKCSRVRWPDGIKDANEMLIKHGANDLRWFIEHAEPCRDC